MVAVSADATLAERLAADLATLDLELAEIDLLVNQARAEAERHEQKRATAADRLAGPQAPQGGGDSPAGLIEQATALATLTRRAAVMEAQVDVLSGKRKALARYRDAVAAYQTAMAEGGARAAGGGGVASDDAAGSGPAVAGRREEGEGMGTRLALAAQESLRREIARAMHDGPAQSLTNIVLQAQIVERLVARDPAAAGSEVRELMAMVQRTLDATKTFIFDVRPMALDDLGLVPTLRTAARDRGRRASIPVAFESLGSDRRLPTDLESALFRVLDDALGAYLALTPDQVALRLSWTAEQLEARLTASRASDAATPTGSGGAVPPTSPPPPAPSRGRGSKGETEIPPALAAMIAQQRDDEAAVAEAARLARRVVLPADRWSEIADRAGAHGFTAELLDEGSTLRVTVDVAQLGSPPGS